MKLSDINQKLTEQPGGFGGIMKAKLKRQLSPFARGVQRKAKGEEALIKKARKVKSALQDYMNQAFRSSGGEKAPITMNQFLGWVKKAQPKYAKGIETYARGEKAYAEYFTQRIDKAGKQSSTASDPKVSVRGSDSEQADTVDPSQDQEDMISPEEMTGEKPSGGDQGEAEVRAAYKKQGEELEAKRKAQGGELVDEDSDDEEPKVDTGASIYEARLRAILEADEEGIDPDVDVGVEAAKVLDDNQIDTLITMGIEKQIELDGGESIVDDPKELASQGVAEPSGTASDDFLSEYQDELESVLTKVARGADLDKRDQRSANDMLSSL